MSVFSWIGTIMRRHLFVLGFVTVVVAGGLSHVLTSGPRDFRAAHTLPYSLFGAAVFAVFAAVYFWFRKAGWRGYDERLGKVHFWLTFIGVHAILLAQYWFPSGGTPSRYADYQSGAGFVTINVISTVSLVIVVASLVPFVWNIAKSLRSGRQVLE